MASGLVFSGLLEDSPPSNAVEAREIDGQLEDPTAGAEYDTSLEALAELIASEAEGGLSAESIDIPAVKWAEDIHQPDYAHTRTSEADALLPPARFAFNLEVFNLLVHANRFRPMGKNGLIAFGLRGGRLVGGDRFEDVVSVDIEDVRPDHESFHCTLGIVDSQNKRIRAYAGSTVPNKDWMRNYFKIVHDIRPHKVTRANLLPTGCYIYRVAAHGGGRIDPALRMTEPDNLTTDAKCTVLRTSADLAYSHDDLWDPTVPYDNIHCAYSEKSFSSAGCQTIKGANGSGPWGAFQRVIGSLGRNARIDYVLLTARDAAIASAILAAGRENDPNLVETCLGRLRVGSEGELVAALQRKLGFSGSGYFGPSTKKRLTEAEAGAGLNRDGVYCPADDRTTGWAVFPAAGPAPAEEGDPAHNLRLAGAATGDGVWDERNPASVRVTHGAGKQSLRAAGNLSLTSGTTEFPLRLEIALDGLPPVTTGVTVEVTIAAVRTSPAQVSSNRLNVVLPAAATSGVRVLISREALDKFCPNALVEYRDILISDGTAILSPLDINSTPRRLSHFLAQIGHESGGFRLRTESLNYTSAARLMEVWPGRFPTLASAQPFVRNEPALAEKVYGGRLGNVSLGDGFRYRGRGLIQLTGRDAYAEFSDRVGVDLVADPDKAFEPRTALRIAAEYWANRKLSGERSMNDLADDDKIRAVTYRINGGSTNLAEREAELTRARRIWGDTTAVASGIIDRGDQDDRVRQLQLLLVQSGFLTGTADGKFGFNTYKALFAFKTRMGLDGKGFADAGTFAALQQVNLSEDEAALPGDLPVIGEEPEPVRTGVSLGDDASIA